MEAGRLTESFVARIWLERDSNGEPVWRGHIRHVQSAQHSYFQDLAQMGGFMEHVTGIPWRPIGKGSNRDAARR